jgi:hypothetical protein
MTSSRDRKSAVEPAVEKTIEPLPPALSSMWRLCKLGYRHEPRLMVAAFVLSQLAALPDALLALWLMLLGEGVLEHRPVMVQGAAVGLGVSAASATKLRLRSSLTSRGCRHRSQPSRIRKARSISTACTCSATRCSYSTTCTCRYFPRLGGSCVSR